MSLLKLPFKFLQQKIEKFSDRNQNLVCEELEASSYITAKSWTLVDLNTGQKDLQKSIEQLDFLFFRRKPIENSSDHNQNLNSIDTCKSSSWAYTKTRSKTSYIERAKCGK